MKQREGLRLLAHVLVELGVLDRTGKMICQRGEDSLLLEGKVRLLVATQIEYPDGTTFGDQG